MCVMEARAGQKLHDVLGEKASLQIGLRGRNCARWCTVWEIDPRTMVLEESMLLVIDGDDSSSKTAAVSKLLLLSDGAAEKLVDIIIAVGRSDVRERCCGGQGVPLSHDLRGGESADG